MKKSYLLVIGVSLLASITNAQTTFNRVYSILQTNCASSNCHDNAAKGGLNFNKTENEVYNMLVNQVPSNIAAANKGYKLVDPGHNYNSFLLRKINNGLEADRGIDANEGNVMPVSGSLKNEEIELISSWILHGAPETGTPVNEQVIIDYYNGKGIPSLPKPPAPDPSEGFQLHFGSIYLAPSTEIEFFKKEKVEFTEDVEIDKIETEMNGQSHHFLLYKFDNPTDANKHEEGLRELTFSNGGAAMSNNSSLVAGWQNSSTIELPEGTGYFWDATTILDLNYHFLNYNTDSVLKAEVYMNIYYQPRQNNTIEMHSELANNFFIPIPAQQTKTFEKEEFDSNSDDTTFIWLLSTHTHKYGTDYDIFLRSTNGARGSKIYEGSPFGFYDWAHPPVEYFEPLLPVPAKAGLIHEATYNNYGNSNVGFGFTTNDEMMLIFIQYTLKKPKQTTVGNQIITAQDKQLKVYPNPATNELNITNIANQNISEIELIDILGNVVASVPVNGNTNFIKINKNELGIVNGIYFIKSISPTKTYTERVIFAN